MVTRKVELSFDDDLISLTDEELDAVAAGVTIVNEVTATLKGPVGVGSEIRHTIEAVASLFDGSLKDSLTITAKA